MCKPIVVTKITLVQTYDFYTIDVVHTGGIIWEVGGRGSGSKGIAYHTDSPTQVEDFDLGW